jgi:glycosyltransferase involved in cell wall biosynthesis
VDGEKPAEPSWRPGIIIPTYRHVARLPEIVSSLREAKLPVLVVDDGNAPEAASAIAALQAPDVAVVRRASNGGKGAAMKTGFRAAAELGWTHALQVDADGQHDVGAAARLLELSRANPRAVVCGVPEYDASVPKARKFGRYVTHVWVWIETMSRDISDSMCGFRVYPVAEALDVLRREMIGDRMDFDTEILVHLYWRGLDVIEAPVRVTYPEGNISNFDLLRDNVRISLMHARLAVQAPVRAPLRWAMRRARR